MFNFILAKQFQFCCLQFYYIITQDSIHLVKRMEKKHLKKHYEQMYIIFKSNINNNWPNLYL